MVNRDLFRACGSVSKNEEQDLGRVQVLGRPVLTNESSDDGSVPENIEKGLF